MDQIKIGKFIAAMRKEQNLTQRQLAGLLQISDKTVSKWECGNGMPEVGTMLPLCETLHINVNELLTGERLNAGYQEKAEENLVDLVQEKESEIVQSRKKMVMMTAASVCAIALWFFLFADSNVYHFGDRPTPLTLCYLTVGFAGIYAAVVLVALGVLRKNVSIVFAALSTSAFVSLLIGIAYRAAWLLAISTAGMLLCAVLSVWCCWKSARKDQKDGSV